MSPASAASCSACWPRSWGGCGRTAVHWSSSIPRARPGSRCSSTGSRACCSSIQLDVTDPDLIPENGADEDARRRAAFVPRPGSWAVGAGEAELLADADRPGAYLLALDEVAQSYVDLMDPTHLEFGYVQALALLVDVLGPPAPRPVDAVHVGGGAATLARWISATRPTSAQIVLESDAALVSGLEERIGAEGFSYRTADGREGL